MVLVVGASGMLGTEVCSQLAARGKKVRALVRATTDAAKIERLRGLGAEIVEGDLRDKRSLEVACEGAEAVICTASALPFSYVADANTPASTDRDGVSGLVDAARSAGVGHFVHTSFPEYAVDFPLQDAKRAAEKHLQESGLNYTILQANYFSEVWLSPGVGFDYTKHTATIYGDGKNPISYVSYRDVATFAVDSLENPAARNAVLPLGGPEALSPLEVVSIFEKVSGEGWQTAHVPVDALQAQLAAATDPFQKSFAGLMIAYALGVPMDMTEMVTRFAVRLTSVEEYARQVSAPAPAEAAA